MKYWSEANGRLNFTNHHFYFNGQKRMFEISHGAVVQSPRFIVKRGADYMLNMLGFDANSKSFKVYFCKRKKGAVPEYQEKQLIFSSTGSPIFSSSQAVKKSFKFNVEDFDEGFLQFEYEKQDLTKWGGLFMAELDFYEGSNDRKWQPAPEDSEEPIEAVKTQVTQLAGSWSVKNLSSAGDVLNSINLLANGTNRIDGRLTHITGQTVIDNAVIKDGMIEKVSANKLTAGTIDANDVDIINLNAKSITSGTFKGLTYEGGIIRGNNGNTEINLNSNVTTYKSKAKIEFLSPSNSLEFNSGGNKAFLSPSVSTGTNYGAISLGVNGRGELDSDANFTGIKIFNEPRARMVTLVGDVRIVKDPFTHLAQGKSLAELFGYINDNFKMLREFRNRHGEGSPGFWDVSL